MGQQYETGAREETDKFSGGALLMSRKQSRFMHNVIALVYDFDGTLTPQPMQEYIVEGIRYARESFDQSNRYLS